MKIVIFVSSLLVFLVQLDVVNGGQVALRPRPKKKVLSRSIPSKSSIFDPTDEESFHVVGVDDPNNVIKTVHQASKRKYVNFEKFEDYLRPQERLCTPSPDNKTTILSFPLDRALYLAARERWAGEKGLLFIGHDPSCYAPEEERSAFKSLSIAFDDALQTIRVTGKPLRFGDRHFPAPTELIIGRAPRDVILTPRKTGKEDFHWPGWGETWGCIKHPMKCFRKIIKHLNIDIDSPDKHISFDSGENEPHKKYWPPDELKDNTGVPELFELYCLECRTAGGVDQEIHIIFNPISGSDDDDDNDDDDDDDDGDEDEEDDNRHLSRRDDDDDEDDEDDDDDDDDGDFRQMFQDHVQRAYVKYTVTDEVKIRKQFEILSNVAADVYCNVALVGTTPPGAMACSPAVTAGALQWKPGVAKEDKAARAKAMGPKEVGDKKAGSGKTSSWGYSIWPMDVGIYVWMDLGISTQVNLTLPGFEATIPVGSELEIDLMGGGDEGPIDTTNFDPIIELLPVDLSIASTEIHFNIAVGPKAGLNIGLPKGKLGIGIGVRLDVIRIENKLSEYKNVTSSCTEPETGGQQDVAFENAFGFTMDLKTGLYAFLNLLGFYIDTNWIGDKVGSDFFGLYWGIKNLVAKCGDCGNEPCFSQAINKLLDVALDGFGFVDKKASVSELSDSAHVAKDSIYSLDDSIVGDDMPTGDPEKACYAKPASGISRRQIFGDEDKNTCQPN